MSEVTRKIERHRRWRAWAGSVDQLRRIGELCEEIFAERKQQLVKEFQVKHLLDDVPDESQVGRRTYEQIDLSVRTESTVFIVTAEHGDDAVSGPLDQVLQEVDRRTVTRIKMKASFSFAPLTEQLEIVFDWAWYKKPVDLVVSSRNAAWANQAFVRLGREIDAGRPKVGVIHHPVFTWVFVGVCSLALALSAHLVLGGLTAGTWDTVVPVLIGAPVAILGNLALTFRKVFPALELYEPGNSSTLARRLAFIGSTVVIAFFVGVVVNKIS